MSHFDNYGTKQALKLVDEALQSDSKNENEVAYSKYLQSVSAIAMTLLANRSSDFSDRFSQQQRNKLIVTAQQCLDRISCLSELLNDEISGIDDVKVISGQKPFDKIMSAVSSDTLIDVPAFTTKSHNSQNKSISVLETIDWVSAEEPLDKHVIQDCSPLEKAKRLNLTLLTKYEARMANCTQASARINMALELHRRMAENLKIAREQERLYTQNMQDKQRERFQEAVKKMSLSALKHCTDSELKMKAEQYIKILQYGEKKNWVRDLKKRLRENPEDGELVDLVVRTTLRDSEHPISKWLAMKTKSICDRMKYLISSANCQPEVYITKTQGKKESREKPTQNVDHHKDRKSCNSFSDSYKENKNDVEVAMEIGEEVMSQLKETVKDQNILAEASVRFIKRLRSKRPSETDTELTEPTYMYESISKELDKLAYEIPQVLSDVVELFLLTYDQLMSKSNLERCSVAVEKKCYPDVWNLLSNVCQLVHKDEILSVNRAMIQMTNITPAELEFGLEECSVATPDKQQKLIKLLQHMIELEVPNEKLQVLVKILCDECQQSSEDNKSQRMGADDLIPLLSYICIRSRFAVLLSECHLLERLINQRKLMGEEGYCLTSLQTAIKYIQSCDREIELDLVPKETSV